MAESTKIQWADATWNPWRGCTKVSEGCANCYAEVLSRRNPKVLGEWGPNGVRSVGSDDYWRQPYHWNKKAEKENARRRVFFASMADVFEDRPELVLLRDRAFNIIKSTQMLDYLCLTKRPENMLRMLSDLRSPEYCQPMDYFDNRNGWPNVWLGTSVESQKWADHRIPHLIDTPAVCRWLSVEPLLEPVNITPYLASGKIHWVIVGGESGGDEARPFDLNWARNLRTQCKQEGVAFFMKQAGDNPRDAVNPGAVIPITTPKGGEPDEWPEDLRIREVPNVVRI